MDQAFQQTYLDRFESVSNLEHKAILTALLRTELSVAAIANSLRIGHSRVYTVAAQYFGSDFIRKRRDRVAACRLAENVSSGKARSGGDDHVTVIAPAPRPALPVKAAEAKPAARAPGRPRGARDGWQAVLRALENCWLKGEVIRCSRIAREAGISQLCAARYLERAIAFAVCGRLPEPAGEEPDARRGDGGITFCRYVGSPQNHCRPSCPELFALADGRSGGQGLREVKITVDGATVSWSSGGCDTAAVAGIVRSLRAVKEERGNGGE